MWWLTVTLFVVAINSVIAVLPEGVFSSLYVGDLSISFFAARMPFIERKLQVALNRISQWAATRGLRFSASKTVAMHFCRLRSVHPGPDLYLYDRRISCVEETRFLGLIFDSRLTWVHYLRYIKAACMHKGAVTSKIFGSYFLGRWQTDPPNPAPNSYSS